MPVIDEEVRMECGFRIDLMAEPKFSNRAEFDQWADENSVLSGLTLTKPPYIGGFRHFAIENLV
jgi:hypothetical protein